MSCRLLLKCLKELIADTASQFLWAYVHCLDFTFFKIELTKTYDSTILFCDEKLAGFDDFLVAIRLQEARPAFYLFLCVLLPTSNPQKTGWKNIRFRVKAGL